MPPLALVLAVGSLAMAMNADLAGSAWRPSHLSSTDLPADNRIVMKFDGGQLTGYGGCNRFFSAYSVSGETIRIGPLASTRKGCPATMDLEASFFAALRAAKTFQHASDRLVLFDAKGGELAQFVQVDDA